MRRVLAFTVAISCTASLALAASRQGTPGAPKGLSVHLPRIDASRLQVSDEEFVMKVSEGSAKAIETGKVASVRALNAEVKAFAARMVKAHGDVSAELIALARTRNLDAKSDLAAAKVATIGLNAFSGLDFDRAYITQMVHDHEVTVELFEAQSRTGQDPAVRAWVASALPTLRDHLQVARDLQSRIGSPSPRR